MKLGAGMSHLYLWLCRALHNCGWRHMERPCSATSACRLRPTPRVWANTPVFTEPRGRPRASHRPLGAQPRNSHPPAESDAPLMSRGRRAIPGGPKQLSRGAIRLPRT